MKKHLKDLALFTAGIPRHEEHMPEALPGIYVIAASVLVVAFFVAIGSGLIASRSLPEVWPEVIRWPVIIIIAIIMGAFIYLVDHALIIAGEGISSRYVNIILLVIRICFVIIFSSNFAYEIVLWQHEESLNLTRLSLEQEQLRKDKDNITKLYDLPGLREAQNSISNRISVLQEQREVLPKDINEKFIMARKASAEATVFWRQWMTLKDSNDDRDILERVRQEAIRKSYEAKRIETMAQRAKNEYRNQMEMQIDEQTNLLGDTRKRLSKAQEKAGQMIEPRSEAIKKNYSARSVNRAALEKLRKENPGIDLDIIIKFLLFSFIELLPITLKLIIGISNPIFLKISQKLVTEASYYRSLMWLEEARAKASHDALRTPEMNNSMREHSFMQINARLPFLRYHDVLEDGMRHAAGIHGRKGITPDLYEMFFGAANEAYIKAREDGDGKHKTKQNKATRSRRTSPGTFQ